MKYIFALRYYIRPAKTAPAGALTNVIARAWIGAQKARLTFETGIYVTPDAWRHFNSDGTAKSYLADAEITRKIESHTLAATFALAAFGVSNCLGEIKAQDVKNLIEAIKTTSNGVLSPGAINPITDPTKRAIEQINAIFSPLSKLSTL